MPEKIDSGAEAIIFLDNDIIKDRVRKDYRIPEIDTELRKIRTRREAKVLEALGKIGFPAPRLIDNDRTSIIRMEYIRGRKVRDVLEGSDYRRIAGEIGRKVALLHNNGIIHGDLTTSNMILRGEVFFIDFGLSHFSVKIEDMAVDLHLLRQALESKHHTIWEDAFREVIAEYRKAANNSEDILRRLESVELRGRNKAK